jgi:hypothetical protein
MKVVLLCKMLEIEWRNGTAERQKGETAEGQKGIVQKSFEKKKKNLAHQNLSYSTRAQLTIFIFEKKGAGKPVRTSSMCS